MQVVGLTSLIDHDVAFAEVNAYACGLGSMFAT